MTALPKMPKGEFVAETIDHPVGVSLDGELMEQTFHIFDSRLRPGALAVYAWQVREAEKELAESIEVFGGLK